jgi:hypothetical protein
MATKKEQENESGLDAGTDNAEGDADHRLTEAPGREGTGRAEPGSDEPVRDEYGAKRPNVDDRTANELSDEDLHNVGAGTGFVDDDPEGVQPPKSN